jgi:hypothetical protein
VKRLFILAVIIFVNACATQVTSLKQGDKITLEANKGFVLLGIQTSQSLKTIRISGPQNIELNSNDVKEGTNYLLIDLKAGKYTIDRLDLDNYRYIDFDNDEYWEFNVSPGQISYVGHIEVIRRGGYSRYYRTELVNRSSEALEFLKQKHEIIYSQNTMSYGGPGEDLFFEFLNLTGGTE